MAHMQAYAAAKVIEISDLPEAAFEAAIEVAQQANQVAQDATVVISEVFSTGAAQTQTLVRSSTESLAAISENLVSRVMAPGSSEAKEVMGRALLDTVKPGPTLSMHDSIDTTELEMVPSDEEDEMFLSAGTEWARLVVFFRRRGAGWPCEEPHGG